MAEQSYMQCARGVNQCGRGTGHGPHVVEARGPRQVCALDGGGRGGEQGAGVDVHHAHVARGANARAVHHPAAVCRGRAVQEHAVQVGRGTEGGAPGVRGQGRFAQAGVSSPLHTRVDLPRPTLPAL